MYQKISPKSSIIKHNYYVGSNNYERILSDPFNIAVWWYDVSLDIGKDAFEVLFFHRLEIKVNIKVLQRER